MTPEKVQEANKLLQEIERIERFKKEIRDNSEKDPTGSIILFNHNGERAGSIPGEYKAKVMRAVLVALDEAILGLDKKLIRLGVVRGG